MTAKETNAPRAVSKKSPKEEVFSMDAFKRMLPAREYDILVAYGTKESYSKTEAEKVIKGVMK